MLSSDDLIWFQQLIIRRFSYATNKILLSWMLRFKVDVDD